MSRRNPKLDDQRFEGETGALRTLNGTRIADCVEACCIVCAKADFIGKRFIADEAEVELNRIYALEDKRPPRPAAPQEE